ncbi:MAG: hypothetical protein QW815_00320 [Nitrososphaerota archaeon]
MTVIVVGLIVTVVVERVPDGGVAVADGVSPIIVVTVTTVVGIIIVPLIVTIVVVVPTDSKNYYVIFTK